MIQLLHLQMTTGKNHTFDTWTFIGKMIFLLFNTLYLFIKTVLPRSKRLLISWLQSSSTVILDSLKIKSVTVSSFPLSVCLEVMGPDAMVWFFKCCISSQFFHPHEEALLFLFTFCRKGGVICISEVIDISPSNLDAILCFIQPSVSHDVLCIEVK